MFDTIIFFKCRTRQIKAKKQISKLLILNEMAAWLKINFKLKRLKIFDHKSVVHINYNDKLKYHEKKPTTVTSYLLFPISSKISFTCTNPDKTTHHCLCYTSCEALAGKGKRGDNKTKPHSPGLYVMRQDLLVHVPSGKIKIWGHNPPDWHLWQIWRIVLALEFGSSRRTKTGWVNSIKAIM